MLEALLFQTYSVLPVMREEEEMPEVSGKIAIRFACSTCSICLPVSRMRSSSCPAICTVAMYLYHWQECDSISDDELHCDTVLPKAASPMKHVFTGFAKRRKERKPQTHLTLLSFNNSAVSSVEVL